MNATLVEATAAVGKSFLRVMPEIILTRIVVAVDPSGEEYFRLMFGQNETGVSEPFERALVGTPDGEAELDMLVRRMIYRLNDKLAAKREREER